MASSNSRDRAAITHCSVAVIESLLLSQHKSESPPCDICCSRVHSRALQPVVYSRLNTVETGPQARTALTTQLNHRSVTTYDSTRGRSVAADTTTSNQRLEVTTATVTYDWLQTVVAGWRARTAPLHCPSRCCSLATQSTSPRRDICCSHVHSRTLLSARVTRTSFLRLALTVATRLRSRTAPSQ